MADNATIWLVGDRVELNPTNRKGDDVTGTVTKVDDGGVYVDMDRPIRGVSWCYASKNELTRIVED